MFQVDHDGLSQTLTDTQVYVEADGTPHMRPGAGRTAQPARLVVLDIFTGNRDRRTCEVTVDSLPTELPPAPTGRRHQLVWRQPRWRVVPEAINPDDQALPEVMHATPLGTEFRGPRLSFRASACGGRYIAQCRPGQFYPQGQPPAEPEPVYLVIAARTGIEAMHLGPGGFGVTPQTLLETIEQLDVDEYTAWLGGKFLAHSSGRFERWLGPYTRDKYTSHFRVIRTGRYHRRLERQLTRLLNLTRVDSIPAGAALLIAFRESGRHLYHGDDLSDAYDQGGLDQLGVERPAMVRRGVLSSGVTFTREESHDRPNYESRGLQVRTAGIDGEEVLLAYAAALGLAQQRSEEALTQRFPDQTPWLTRFQRNFFTALAFAASAGSLAQYSAYQRTLNRQPGKKYGLGVLLDYLEQYAAQHPPGPGDHPAYPLDQIARLYERDAQGHPVHRFDERPGRRPHYLDFMLARTRRALAAAAAITSLEAAMLRRHYEDAP